MSGPASPSSGDPSVPLPKTTERLSLRRLAQAWPRAIVTAWAAIVVVLLARVLGDPGVEISGDPDALLPVEHRAPEDRPLLLLTVDEAALGPGQGGADVLQSTAAALAEQLGPRRLPLGPPRAELTAWLDAHALYLLPVSTHEVLTERLGDAAMAEAVDGLRARLSSPLYGVSGEEPRRDPLRLQELARAHAGRLTHLGNAEDMPAELTAAGNLMTLDGHALLMQLRDDAEPATLRAQVQAAIAGQPVEAALVGPRIRRERARAGIEDNARRLWTVGLAALVVVLALSLRAIRSVAAIVLCLGSGLVGLLALGDPLSVHGIPLLVLLMGFGCEGALHLPRISRRGWPAAAILSCALLPLWLSPYPAWQRWAVQWLVAMIAVIVLLRVVAPALLTLWRLDPAPARRGFRLHPVRSLAVLLALAALGSGMWALPRLPTLALDRTPLAATARDPERRIREGFFDPRLVALARTPGDDPAQALERSAEHARQLASLVPEDATRVDSPGRLVLPPHDLEARRRSLMALKLDDRMAALREQLATRGFRPDAFGEFLRGATDLESLPTPQAALDGPLGAWIGGYLESEGGAALLTRVHLRADADAGVPRIETSAGEILALQGPVVAARRDRQLFADWLGIYLAIQLWVGAVVVWLGTRSLATALASSCAALCAQTALLAVMVPLELSLGPALLPALLLTGAAAMVAGARACGAVLRAERFYATGVLLTGLCQAIAGLVLLTTDQPLWVTVGLVVALGALLASGAGLFIAPGMLRMLGGAPRTSSGPWSADAAPAARATPKPAAPVPSAASPDADPAPDTQRDPLPTSDATPASDAETESP